MALKLFPSKEYIIESPLTKMEAKNAISENVMEREMFTMDFVSEFADKRMGMYRYFEGTVGDDDFSINRKRYSRGHSSFTIFKVVPSIQGKIIEMRKGVDVSIGFKGPNPTLMIVFMLLSVLFALIVKKETAMPLLISIPGFAIYWTIIILIQRVLYNNRVQKDYEQLKLIFKAEEIPLQRNN